MFVIDTLTIAGVAVALGFAVGMVYLNASH